MSLNSTLLSCSWLFPEHLSMANINPELRRQVINIYKGTLTLTPRFLILPTKPTHQSCSRWAGPIHWAILISSRGYTKHLLVRLIWLMKSKYDKESSVHNMSRKKLKLCMSCQFTCETITEYRTATIWKSIGLWRSHIRENGRNDSHAAQNLQVL